MRLSSLTTDKAVDVLCAITPHAASISGDAELSAALKEKIGTGASIAEIYLHGSQTIAKVVPILLQNHRDDVFSILAILNESTVEAVREQNVMVTVAQIKELLQDKDLLNFFKSQQPEGAKE